jgi:serine/threonine protein phosphatase PrpC
MPSTSGTTVLLVLIIKETWDTYNLCIGDSRFYYIDKNTGENKITDIHYLDYADESKKTYHGESINKIHHIIGPVIDKNTGLKFPEKRYNMKMIKKKDFVYERYSFPDEYYWEEWVKWNENEISNPSEYIVFPEKDGKAWRMDTLQPSRSLGRKERAIPLGVLYRIKINQNDTIACFGCDGIDDNGATNENNFGQFVVNPKKMNTDFFKEHVGLKCLRKPEKYQKLPEIDSNLLEKITWISGTIEENGPLFYVDNDFKYGIREATDYFIKMEESEKSLETLLHKDDPQCIAERLSYFCSLRLSSDNVTVMIIKFE